MMLLMHGRRTLSRHHLAVFRPLQKTRRCPLTTKPATGRGSRLFSNQQQDVRPVARRKSFDAGLGFSGGRSLATAVDDHRPIQATNYDQLRSSVLPHFSDGSNQNTPYDLRAFDPSSPLVLEDHRNTYIRSRMNMYGISGDVEEMLPLFDACLRVGKIDRAELVLKRLTTSVAGFPAEDLIVLHNQYLRAALDQLRLHPDSARAEGLRQWYELHIRKRGLPQTAETIACMLKASLMSEHVPARRKRLITRYMGMAPGNAGLHVLSMAEILNDQDLAAITNVCPTYNVAPAEENGDNMAPTEAKERVINEDGEQTAEETQLKSMPEVLPTPQKGVGLKSLQQTLSLFSRIPVDCDISTMPIRERREIQSQLERDCVDAAVARWREANESLKKMGLGTSISQAPLSSRLYDWQTTLEAWMSEEMSRIEASEATQRKTVEDFDRCTYGPFMRLSSPSRLAAITIISILNTATLAGIDKGLPLSTAIGSLSKNLEEDIRAQVEFEKAKKPKPKARRVVFAESAKGAASSSASETAHEAHEPSPAKDSDQISDQISKFSEAVWPLAVKAKLGTTLLSALLETAKIRVVKEHPITKALVSQFQPAFYHAVQLRKGKKIGMLLLNKELVHVLKREPMGDCLAKYLPMVVEPEPWKDFDQGAFLQSHASAVRVKGNDKEQKLYAEAAIARGDMDQVFKGLDVLGKTGWRVNKPVLNVMLEVWNTGEAFAKLPPLNPNIEIPPEPEASDNPMERREWIRRVKKAENEKAAFHSQRCFINFQLEVARAFRNQTFYFPHNVDFRGRAYPLPTYLNHMGADHVRGILRFAKGKELGEQGLQWLKIHLANVYGFDKASLKDRASFATDNIPNIIDSANNPLNGKRWWLNAEDPWQCLATCFELKAALECPNPTKFVSHLPVHQDGTCNGLQHYAALGGDIWGAQQVNLAPSDKPADVYTAVADIVKESISKDVAAGNPIAKGLDGKITRKVVKQTVMTNVYGVTFGGARKQICKQFDALYPNLPEATGVPNLTAASYVATLVFKGLSDMFRGAHDIQYWLREIGSRICKALSAEQLERLANDGLLLTTSPASGRQVEHRVTGPDLLAMFRATIVWTTPLRMPVAQPYRKSGTRVIKTALQDLSLTIPDRSDPVHQRKQLQAFPPNFIHSLDATHMILSALECNALGLDFAAVHDSFWTHAADVDSMNRVLRDAFVRIHEEDVVGRLAAEFKARYRGSIYMATVKPGPIATRIQQWRKAQKIKSILKTELLMEYERQNLLRSSDPGDVARGRAMVTPHSIFEEMSESDSQSLAATEELEGLGLGEISEKELKIEEDEMVEEFAGADSQADDAHPANDSQSRQDLAAQAAENYMKAMLVTDTPATSHFAHQITKTTSNRRCKVPVKVNIWMPISFPDVPKKGDFKVKDLKKSKYFFS